MNALGYAACFGAGLLVGWQLLRASETACCNRIARNVRDKVATHVGPGAAAVGDVLNLWGAAPGILDAVGYP